jgi:short-subunit dehydrogenase
LGGGWEKSPCLFIDPDIMALNPKFSRWDQKVVWIVGASTGIGRALAEQLHGKGALVVASARKRESLEALTKSHPGTLAVAVDATDAEALHQAMQKIQTEYGRLDLAVYCAGYYKPMRATSFELAEAIKQNQVNYVGALNYLDAVLPTFMAQKSGHLSLIASVAGFGGLPLGLAYGPTKAALINLAEALYIDLRPLGIGISVVNPGFVETPMTAQNTFKMPALISAEESAGHILRGWQAGDFEIHFPRRFTNWLKLLRLLPRSGYFKTIHRLTGL